MRNGQVIWRLGEYRDPAGLTPVQMEAWMEKKNATLVDEFDDFHGRTVRQWFFEGSRESLAVNIIKPRFGAPVGSKAREGDVEVTTRDRFVEDKQQLQSTRDLDG